MMQQVQLIYGARSATRYFHLGASSEAKLRKLVEGCPIHFFFLTVREEEVRRRLGKDLRTPSYASCS